MKPKAKGKKELSTDKKLEVFAKTYLTNKNNGTKAAIAAGYSEKSAHVTASRLLRNPKVQALIAETTESILDSLDISTERILKERARLAFFDARKLFDKDGRRIPIHMLDADTAAAIAAFDIGDTGVKIRLADKNASLTALERYKGMAGQDGNAAPVDPNMNPDSIEAARAIAFILARAAYYLKKSENPAQLSEQKT